jgi:hypothetical protein
MFLVMSRKTTAKGPRARDGKARRGALGYKGCGGAASSATACGSKVIASKVRDK